MCVVIASRLASAARPLGIDVSNHQGIINWTTIKNDGITFAWAKATEGTSFTDSYFAGPDGFNAANARNAGVLIGAYDFARPDKNLGLSGADAEAAHFWNVAGPYVTAGNTYLMPMLDIEWAPGSSYTKTTLSQWVNRWCNDIKSYAATARVSVTPVIYTFTSYASTWLDSTVSQSWPLWMASWPTNPNPQTGAPSSTSPWATWQFWQYADTGVAGDSDVINGDANVLKDYIIGSPGRFDDGSFVQTNANLNVWSSPASTGQPVVEPRGSYGKILQGPVYGASYQRWQIQYADGKIGWSAEDFLVQAPPISGDFNGDGQVDAADYISWAKGLSPNPHSSSDYTAWRQHFGQSYLGSGSALIGTAAVPEPATLVYLAFLPLVLSYRRRWPACSRS